MTVLSFVSAPVALIGILLFMNEDVKDPCQNPRPAVRIAGLVLAMAGIAGLVASSFAIDGMRQ